MTVSVLDKPTPTPQPMVDKLYKLMGKFDAVMESGGCSYWFEGGTALGAVRNQPGGLIRHDDDLDVGMKLDDEQCLTDLTAKLEEEGVGLVKWYYGYKFFFKDGPVVEDAEKAEKGITMPFGDVFLVECDENGQTKYPRTSWYKKCHFSCSALDTLESCSFGPLTGKCPPKEYFVNCYGENYMTHGKTPKDHNTGVEGDGSSFKLDKDDLTPALPSEERSNKSNRKKKKK